MKKIVKNVLIISDDFEYGLDNRLKNGDFYSCKEDNIYKFNAILVESFDTPIYKKYDAVLVDYGFITDSGEEKLAIKKLQEIVCKKIPLAWVGGLAGHYDADCKKIFPKLKFLHNLPSSFTGRDDIMYLLYNLIKK